MKQIRLSPIPNKCYVEKNGEIEPVPPSLTVIERWIDKQETAISENNKGRLWLINNREEGILFVRALEKMGVKDKAVGSAGGQIVQQKDVEKEKQRRYQQLMKIAKRQMEEDLPGNAAVQQAAVGAGGKGNNLQAPQGKVGTFQPAPNAAAQQKKERFMASVRNMFGS
jgi:hypothetical protein